jgi:hypothetical protein
MGEEAKLIATCSLTLRVDVGTTNLAIFTAFPIWPTVSTHSVGDSIGNRFVGTAGATANAHAV